MTSSPSQPLRQWMPLFLISSLSLFFEIAVIRWLSSEIRVLAYFKNLILLAAFIGLSIGFAVAGKGRSYLRSFIWMWGVFSLLTVGLGWFTGRLQSFYPGSADEYLWGVYPSSFWLSLGVFLAIAVIFFMMCMFLFIPLGQATGEEMAKHPPVQAYIINILASLLGVWAFSLLSYLQTPPVVWFTVGLAGLCAYLVWQKLLNWRGILVFLVTLVGIAALNWGVIWSPYNRLSLKEFTATNPKDNSQFKIGYWLAVQQTAYQNAIDFSEQGLAKLKGNIPDSLYTDAVQAAAAYSLPYQLKPSAGQVLIIGSGMGNDVAAALRGNTTSIDAIDIDPAIIDLGRKLHPEQPYADPRVNIVIEDARSFFNKTDKTYDLVVFGLLDSHTLLSTISSVRLDSFVYTTDSFEKVKTLLKPGGYVAITFATNDWIEDRLGRMMAQVFGADKIYVIKTVIGTTYIAGALTPEQLANTGLSIWQPNPDYADIPLATDDWPNLYLRTRLIPNGYWQTLLVILLISLLLMRRTFPGALRPDWHFFLLGAAFLLIEFKSVTELALLFGTTWFVNSLAISGVLVMALLANLYVLRHPRINVGLAYTLLFASLALSFFFPLQWLAGWAPALKALLSTTLLSIPLLFAGVIFSESLRRTGETSRPLASNFLGSAAGGLLEYASLLWGIKSLYVIAAGLYLAAMAVFARHRKPG
jgi:spermidine synthase